MSDPIRVLILDDEVAIRESLALYLEDRGMETCTAGEAETALRMVEQTRPHVAVVDLRLSGMDGETFIRHAHNLSPGTRYVIYTGSTTYRPSETLRTLGVTPDQVFVKPVRDLPAFAEIIRRTAGESREG